MMDPGRLKHRIKLQEPSTTQDAAGQPLPAWIDVATVRADIRVASGVETIKADAGAAIGKASVRIRARSGVTAVMRFLHGTTAYNILAVPPVNNDPRYLDLPCEVIDVQS